MEGETSINENKEREMSHVMNASSLYTWLLRMGKRKTTSHFRNSKNP